MSEMQLSELYEKLSAAKSKKPESIFVRGWNAAIDFAIKQMRAVCDEPEEDNDARSV